MAAVKIIGKVAVKVIPDTSDFKDRLKRDLEKYERQLSPRKIKVVPDWDKTAAKKVKQQFDQLRRSMNGKNVNINPNLKSTAGISAELSLLTRDRKISIEPDLDQKAVAGVLTGLLALSGGRVHLDSLREGFERLQEFDRLVPQIATTAAKVTLLGAAAFAATGHVFALSSSLLSIAGAGLALPGILGGIITGVGVTAAAFADFNKVLPEVQDKLNALQNSLSANFWAEAEGPIRNMIDSLWPAFSAGVNGAATAIGTFFGSLATELSGMDLEPMFDALIESVKAFTPYTDNIASIIEKLGTVGSAFLPRLAEYFGGLIAQFDTWLGTGAKMNQWIETGITNLLAFFDVIGSIASIFGGIARAASDAGGVGLVQLADGLGRIADIVNSDGFQKGLTDVFRAANDAIGNLLSGAAPGLEAMILNIRDLFVTIAPQVGEAVGGLIGNIATALGSPLVKDGITAMFDGIINAVETLQGAAGPLVMILAVLAPIVGALAENIAMVVTNGLDRMAPAFQLVADAVLPLIDTLGSLANDVLTQLQPLWETMTTNLANVLTALNPLIEAFQNLWNIVAPVVIPVLQFLAGLIGDTIVMAIHGVTDIIEGMVRVFQGVIDFVTGVFTGDWDKAWGGIKDIFGGIFEAIWGIVQTWFAVGALKLISGGWKAIKGLFDEFGPTLKNLAEAIWESIKTRAGTLWADIKAVPQLALSAIKDFFTGMKDDIVTAAQLIWETIKTKAVSKMNEVTDIFKDMPGKILGFLTGAGTLLYNIGESIIQGLLDGILKVWENVKDTVGGMADWIKAHKGPISYDRVLLKPAGKAIIEGLLVGLESQYKTVADSLKGFTRDIAGALDTGADYRLGVAANLDTSSLGAGIGALTASVGASVAAPSSAADGPIHIDNITIPLDDLQQLKSLEDFMNMLRVRTRQGVVANA